MIPPDAEFWLETYLARAAGDDRQFEALLRVASTPKVAGSVRSPFEILLPALFPKEEPRRLYEVAGTVWEKLREYRPRLPARVDVTLESIPMIAFLRTTTFNEMVDLRRREAREARAREKLAREPLPPPPTPPDDEIAHAEFRFLFRELVKRARLSEQERAVLELELQGLSIEEMAESLNRSENLVRVVCSKARLKLSKYNLKPLLAALPSSIRLRSPKSGSRHE